MAKRTFQAEIKQLLDLMIHSLYSNKEIFLRELISNANDAIDKLSYLNVSNDDYKGLDFSPEINISFDSKKGTITVSDNGIGMDEGDLNENLGTIAKSGTKSFLNSLSGDKKKDSNLIGQFGVGFYSSFMVADKVVVNTKKALSDKAFTWVSSGDGEYEILESSKDGFGTSITVYLKDGEKNFASRWECESVIKKYSNHIQFPIFLEYDEEVRADDHDKDGAKDSSDSKVETKIEHKREQINVAKALWITPKSELKKEDYHDFYKTSYYDSEPPMAYVHTHAEGNLQYNSLFYIPKRPPFDMHRVDYKPGVKLYVKRVFITDDDKDLLPSYLRFVRGVIDSDDLPLNVSREILQQNRILANIKKASVKKVLGCIEDIAKDEKEYAEFYGKFGKVLKEGLYGDFENKDKLLNLLRAFSVRENKEISLSEYKSKMKGGQKAIYYSLGDSIEVLKNNPVLEKFGDFDVLLFSDEIDGFIMPRITEYDGTKLVDVMSKQASEDIGLGDVDDVRKEEFSKLVSIFKENEEVDEVRLCSNLTSPLALIKDTESSITNNFMRQMGQEPGEVKKSVEINVDHPLIVKLNSMQDDDLKRRYCNILYCGAKILDGDGLKDSKGYVDSINDLLSKSL